MAKSAMSDSQSSEETSSESAFGPGPPRQELSLLDILLVLARNTTFIVWVLIGFLMLGVAYSLLLSDQYTSSATVIRKIEGKGDGGLPGGIPSGALSGLGISLGGNSGGLTPRAYPDILRSREVRLAVVRDTFRFPDAERPMTFVEYNSRPPGLLSVLSKYTIKLPWTLKSRLSHLISGSSSPQGSADSSGLFSLNESETNAVEAVGGMIETSIDQESGLMRIAVTGRHPRVAANLAESFLSHLSSRVRKIRTEKMRERLKFVESRFQEVEEELESSENRLAEFLEQNQNPNSARLQFQRDRLQRQVGFKEQLYSELQSQLTQTRLDLQQQQPVVTVAEKPIPPMEPSSPNRTFIVVIFALLGIGFGVGVSFAKTSFEKWKEGTEESQKIKEIQGRLIPSFISTVWDDGKSINGTLEDEKAKEDPSSTDAPTE